MEQRGLALVLGTLALAAILGVPRNPVPAAPPRQEGVRPAEPAPAAPPPTATPAPAPPAGADPGEIVRLYREFFGVPGKDLATVLRARPSGYGLEFMIALVPDPVDSYLPARFDQGLDAIQQSFAASSYLLDRAWLPWTEKDKDFRTVPGALLFRKPGALATVFLVGESPKSGIQKDAFVRAVEIVRTAAPGAPVKVLGPSYSGSAASLRILLDGPLRNVPFTMVTGSATTGGLEEIFKKIDFCRTVVPDPVVQQSAYRFLAETMGWDLRRVALLVESDTAYGQRTTYGARSLDEHFVRVQFPSRISGVRAASEREGDRPGKEEGSAARPPKTLLDLGVSEQGRPVDVIPPMSALTARSNDLELANLLETISREGIRYVGILATDARDTLFLAERVRAFSKGVVLFTFDNNLLYAHPQVARTMNGTLVLTSFPLFTEGQPWLEDRAAARLRRRQQFTSEFQQGIFHAVQRLLDPAAPLPAPRVWVSAVGDGSLWPIADLDAGDPSWSCAASMPAPQAAPPENEAGEAGERSPRADVYILLTFGVLFLLAFSLRAIVPPPDLPASDEAARDSAVRTRWLFSLGVTVLFLAGSLLAVLGAFPQWAFSLTLPSSNRPYLITLALAYVGLVWTLARTVRPFALLRIRNRAAWVLAWVVAAAILIQAIVWVLLPLWIPDEREFFYLRLRNESSGLSPLVSLAWLGLALLAWTFLELKRCRLTVRQSVEWPFEGCPERPLTGCADTASELRQLLNGFLFSSRFKRFWIVAAAALVPPVYRLAQTLQPIAEVRPYGQVFLALVVVILVFAANSFYRFFAAWLKLLTLLRRLDHTRLIKGFEKIAPEVNWNPMKAFGWQIPTFNVLTLSARRLEALDARSDLDLPGDTATLDALLGRIFDAERRGDFQDEVAARVEIREIFLAASRELESRTADPEALEFLALRVVAYLRYVFAHLRNCLMGAMAPLLLLLIGVTTYAFEPKQFLSFGLWVALLAAAALTLWTFVEMDRNPTLSAIGGSTAGKVTFNRSFVLNAFTYGAIPLIGVITTQFPYFGRLFATWFDPLVRLASGAG
jgi:hypothetical protein